jgi:5-methyltetrahydropteroyltriglutamate--homocysteine methyltransferase
MRSELPLLPTVCVGSYASPSWFIAAQRLVREGQMGDQEVNELLDDAITICVNDQLDAGIDILSDGEFRRQRFVFELFDALEGLERLPAHRRLGVPGYDKAPRFRRIAPVKASQDLGTVAEFEALKRQAPHMPLKIALPGPLTFASFISAEGEAVSDLFGELKALVRQEIDALVSAGCNYIQLDEPGLTITPYGLSLDAAASAINDVLTGVPANTAVHVCFGNNAGRPFADRRLGRLLPALKLLKCKQLMLEFANREMAEIDLLKPLSEQFSVATGVIDVKNFYVETADDVAERLNRCLAFISPEKLIVTADCGFSALPRYVARAKMRAMSAGARLVRDRLK